MSFKVLVANRGEMTIYTEGDSSHATFADEAVKLESAADFLNVNIIVDVATSTQCTHLHPGYGFLSESPSLPLALERAGGSIVFIGPSQSALRIASDKMLTRELGDSLGVRIAQGRRVTSVTDVLTFAAEQGPGRGYPVIIKALDGGGGRGIRIVEDENGVGEAFKRCLGESPSKQVFVEKALTGPGWKHIEVQVIGDGRTVNHLWERECSVQRRFQKIVEIAPSRLPRSSIQPLLDASLKMARHLQYRGLGTFEFLFNSHSFEWVFLEINPRVQVEHTITEEITNIDLVRSQLLLFSSTNVTLSSISLDRPLDIPTSFAIQLRLTAEDPRKGYQLSPGLLRASDIFWPGGRGVRIDTWLTIGPNNPDDGDVEWTVGTEFDSLLAKVIVTGASFEEATQKGLGALRQLRVGSRGKVKTNVAVLAGTLAHLDWANGAVDTLWLERKAKDVLDLGEQALRPKPNLALKTRMSSSDASPSGAHAPAAGRNNVVLQPGSLFHLTLTPPASLSDQSSVRSESQSLKHTITLKSIAQNAFPDALSGTFISSFPSIFSANPGSTEVSFTLTQSTSVSVSTGHMELANPNDPQHVAAPMTGKIVEVHPALADILSSRLKPAQKSDSRTLQAALKSSRVRKGDPLLILSVMKMENVVAAPFDGVVGRVGNGVQVGAVMGEGMLICVLENDLLDGSGQGVERLSRL
ncbi:carboxylase:pyruvate/acetyl-coa/propionyl-CoA [Gymnopilus junonius]|uniref:Carboxylase:pyruvate/acetyl-coa/propionyl-CoA n=1 Tax=Gymnopilus junonius TaxID=109634 RepID=A0A9P5NU77_GYMJU|nr:carboxylase:pyruvate/acetyl-coa/propionyl-CoA [Gymnopilus junonius]